MEIKNTETLRLLHEYAKRMLAVRKDYFIQRSEEFKWIYSTIAAIGVAIIAFIGKSTADAANHKLLFLFGAIIAYQLWLAIKVYRYFSSKHALLHHVDNMGLVYDSLFISLSEQFAEGSILSVQAAAVAEWLQENIGYFSLDPLKVPLGARKTADQVRKMMREQLQSIHSELDAPSKTHVQRTNNKNTAYIFGLYSDHTNTQITDIFKLNLAIETLNQSTLSINKLLLAGFLFYPACLFLFYVLK